MIKLFNLRELVFIDGFLLLIPWITIIDQTLRIGTGITGIVLFFLTARKLIVETRIKNEELRKLKANKNDTKREN